MKRIAIVAGFVLLLVLCCSIVHDLAVSDRVCEHCGATLVPAGEFLKCPDADCGFVTQRDGRPDDEQPGAD